MKNLIEDLIEAGFNVKDYFTGDKVLVAKYNSYDYKAAKEYIIKCGYKLEKSRTPNVYKIK